MNSAQTTLVSGSFLSVAFVMMTISILSDALFYSPKPEREGFVIKAVEGTAPAAAKAVDAPLAAIAPLLAGASVDKGTKIFRKCQACHTAAEGDANRVGPNLWGIVDRPMASVAGFGYSSAMTAFAGNGARVWDYESLNGFLAAPKKYIRGTAMAFVGLKKEEDRANLIAYLRSLSTAPAPLPGPDAAGEEAAAGR